MSDELFNPDPTKVTTALAILDKNTYVFAVGDPKGYKRMKKDAAGNPTNEAVVGIRYPLTVVAPDSHKGQRQIYDAMVHTEGTLAFSKAFIMACLGYNPRDSKAEQEFNAKFAGGSWSIDVTSGAVGDVWREAKGRQIKLDCDITLQRDNVTQQQVFKNPQPVTV